MPLYRHPGYAVLRVSPGAEAFLKAYTTNLIDAPRTAFLTREGRTVAVAYQTKISGEEALLAVGKLFVDRLTGHLSKYLALSDTKITPAPDYTVYFDSSEPGRALLSPNPQKAEMTSEEYVRFRVEHALAEQGTDFDDEMPLCVDPALVHFEKGCYLGQEIVARVHYRGSPPKRLVVKRQSECAPEEFSRMTSKVTINGEATGFVFVS